jgi:perosamine synthetase
MVIPLAQPAMTEKMRSEAERVLEEEYFVQGETVSVFEREFADFVGSSDAVAVSSGTQAIHLSLRALEVGTGDTVITTPATFIATANAISRTGADVRLVDINTDTYTIDLGSLRRTVAEADDVSAIIPVHLYGYPVDIDAIRNVAPGVPIVSDACQAHGAAIGDDQIGSISDLTAFSFYPSKNMTVGGDGGMVTTDDAELARAVRSLADVGRAPHDLDYEHTRVGYTARLDTVKAAIGRVQLNHLPDWNARRRTVAQRYLTAFDELELELPPDGDKQITPAWYFFVVRTPVRDRLANFLSERGIETGVHYPTPVHLQPPYRKIGYEAGDFPESETWADMVLSFPVHPHLEDGDVEHVISSVRSFFE